MSGELILVIVIVSFAALYFVVPFAVGAYMKYRGKMVVTCPETQKPAGVEVDVKHAALTAAVGQPELRLKDCTRWPERKDCGQECLMQIELAPEDCLVRNILAEWYRDESCAICRKPFGEIHVLDHKPGLLGPDSKMTEWAEIRAEQINEILATHKPICWNCLVTESFVRQHPDLVFERPSKRVAESGKR
ncbi:MAG TPA: hypothetical protein VNN73_01600 [Blastocatellia bacterium]|nr:hypothetical protein [Blastocatellia bacterium]